eukprot:gene3169-biopygen2299
MPAGRVDLDRRVGGVVRVDRGDEEVVGEQAQRWAGAARFIPSVMPRAAASPWRRASSLRAVHACEGKELFPMVLGEPRGAHSGKFDTQLRARYIPQQAQRHELGGGPRASGDEGGEQLEAHLREVAHHALHRRAHLPGLPPVARPRRVDAGAAAASKPSGSLIARILDS